MKEAAVQAGAAEGTDGLRRQAPAAEGRARAPKLRAAMTKASDEQIAKLAPKDAESLKEFKRVVGTALRVDGEQRVAEERSRSADWGRWNRKPDGVTDCTARCSDAADEKDAVPTVRRIRAEGHRRRRPVIWLHPKGKASLFDERQASYRRRRRSPTPGSRLWRRTCSAPARTRSRSRLPVDKGFAGYTYGYNRSLLANRVHDVLTHDRVRHVDAQGKDDPPRRLGRDGLVAVLAKALAGDAVDEDGRRPEPVPLREHQGHRRPDDAARRGEVRRAAGVPRAVRPGRRCSSTTTRAPRAASCRGRLRRRPPMQPTS